VSENLNDEEFSISMFWEAFCAVFLTLNNSRVGNADRTAVATRGCPFTAMNGLIGTARKSNPRTSDLQERESQAEWSMINNRRESCMCLKAIERKIWSIQECSDRRGL
jgi:hypothetical protein